MLIMYLIVIHESLIYLDVVFYESWQLDRLTQAVVMTGSVVMQTERTLQA